MNINCRETRETVESRSKAEAMDSQPEFFTVFEPKISTHQLRIPRAFHKHLRGKLPMKLMTKTYSTQSSWTVRLEKRGEDMFFADGWEQFVMNHPLELGDFLVCRYEGDSTFFVKIYGSNYCGKRTDIGANGRNPPARLQCSDRGRIISEFSNGRMTDSEYCVTQLDEDGEDHEEVYQVTVIRPKGKRGRPRKVAKGNSALDGANAYISSSTYPNFIIIMTESYLKMASMYIPPKFVFEYLKHRKHLYLQISNRMWQVSICKFMGGYHMRDGWLEFVTDNHLQVGDVCVVELVEHKELLCKISIFRCGLGLGVCDG